MGAGRSTATKTLTGLAQLGMSEGMLIYKILSRPQWDAFRLAGATFGAPVDLADGYIHFSAAPQLAETAARHFADQSDLVLLAFDANRLGSALKWEPSRGGALFPHLYAPLPVGAAETSAPLALDAEGAHVLPDFVK